MGQKPHPHVYDVSNEAFFSPSLRPLLLFFFPPLRPLLSYMEVPRPGMESKPQLRPTPRGTIRSLTHCTRLGIKCTPPHLHSDLSRCGKIFFFFLQPYLQRFFTFPQQGYEGFIFSISSPKIVIFCLFFSFFFLWLHLRHMEVPKLGVESELQLLACTTATATRDPSLLCDLHLSSWQCRSLTH